jgi:hypothetical protein
MPRPGSACHNRAPVPRFIAYGAPKSALKLTKRLCAIRVLMAGDSGVGIRLRLDVDQHDSRNVVGIVDLSYYFVSSMSVTTVKRSKSRIR